MSNWILALLAALSVVITAPTGTSTNLHPLVSKHVPATHAKQHTSSRASGARQTGGWWPPLYICPQEITPGADSLELSTDPPICEPEHVYAFLAPADWQAGDPIPPWVKAP